MGVCDARGGAMCEAHTSTRWGTACTDAHAHAHVHTTGYRLRTHPRACPVPQVYYPPFRAAVDAGVASVMCGYNKVAITAAAPPLAPSCAAAELWPHSDDSTDAQTRKDIQTPRHYPDTHPSSTLIPFRCPPDGL